MSFLGVTNLIAFFECLLALAAGRQTALLFKVSRVLSFHNGNLIYIQFFFFCFLVLYVCTYVRTYKEL